MENTASVPPPPQRSYSSRYGLHPRPEEFDHDAPSDGFLVRNDLPGVRETFASEFELSTLSFFARSCKAIHSHWEEFSELELSFSVPAKAPPSMLQQPSAKEINVFARRDSQPFRTRVHARHPLAALPSGLIAPSLAIAAPSELFPTDDTRSGLMTFLVGALVPLDEDLTDEALLEWDFMKAWFSSADASLYAPGPEKRAFPIPLAEGDANVEFVRLSLVDYDHLWKLDGLAWHLKDRFFHTLDESLGALKTELELDPDEPLFEDASPAFRALAFWLLSFSSLLGFIEAVHALEREEPSLLPIRAFQRAKHPDQPHRIPKAIVFDSYERAAAALLDDFKARFSRLFEQACAVPAPTTPMALSSPSPPPIEALSPEHTLKRARRSSLYPVLDPDPTDRYYVDDTCAGEPAWYLSTQSKRRRLCTDETLPGWG